jgi:hypothetical protein
MPSDGQTRTNWQMCGWQAGKLTALKVSLASQETVQCDDSHMGYTHHVQLSCRAVGLLQEQRPGHYEWQLTDPRGELVQPNPAQ